MSLSDTVSVIEIIILVVALIAVASSSLLLAIYMGDRGRIRRMGLNGITQRMVNGNIRNEIWRLWKSLGFATIAVMLMLVPPPARSGNAVVSLWSGLIILTFLITGFVGSLWDYVDRRRNWDDAGEVEARNVDRDAGRDAGRDAVRDEARDIARDAEEGIA